MADQAPKVDRPAALRGAAAVLSAIDEIGGVEADDNSLAKHIVEAELDVRALLKFALAHLTLDQDICD